MYNKAILLLFVLSSFMISFSWAQEYSTDKRKAIKFYEEAIDKLEIDRDLDGGIDLLERALRIDADFVEARIKLARTFKFFNLDKDMNELVIKHLRKAAEIKPDDPEMISVYAELGDLYLKKGDYENALTFYNKVKKYPLASNNIYEKAVMKADNCEFAIQAIKDSFKFEPKKMPKESINRYMFQSHPVLTADQNYMIFSVRKGQGREYNENVVMSKKIDGEWTAPEPIEGINSNMNEGFATISGDGRVLVFVSCNRKDSHGSCDLYISYKNGRKWSEPENMGPDVNSNVWDSEPSLSADGRTLYFSSERKGGFGNRDIYVTYLQDDDTWSVAENLGKNVNSSGWEVTPFIHADGKHLYFASDGYQGFGGYDIYVSRLKNGEWSKPKNLGYPINTEGNEGSLFITPDFKKGYYEKYTREGRNSHSEIYEFDFPEALSPGYQCTYATGIVTNAKTGEPMGAEIDLIDLQTGEVNQRVSSDVFTGEYLVVLTEGKEYALHSYKEDFLFFSMHFDYYKPDNFDPVKLNIELQPISQDETFRLRNIFFETGQYKLKEKSTTELNLIIRLLEENQDMEIEVHGHTDNVGSAADNKQLSLNRANSVQKHLIEKGISKQRVKIKGYGESNPIADNNTDEGRRKNRRIEIKILK